jgi:hypothetical protein
LFNRLFVILVLGRSVGGAAGFLTLRRSHFFSKSRNSFLVFDKNPKNASARFGAVPPFTPRMPGVHDSYGLFE